MVIYAIVEWFGYNYLANYPNALIVFSLKLIEKYYTYNIFAIISQQFLRGRLLLVVTNGKKNYNTIKLTQFCQHTKKILTPFVYEIDINRQYKALKDK